MQQIYLIIRTLLLRFFDDGRTAIERFCGWLDQVLFPKVVSFATHPIVIFLTIILLIPLIVFASITALVLILGNYTNVVSASVSSIVLATQLKHHTQTHKRLDQIEATQAAHHAETHARLDRMEAIPSANVSAPTSATSKRAPRKKKEIEK